jgi:hypothetical protein
MRTTVVLSLALLALVFVSAVSLPTPVFADSRGDELAKWLNARGVDVWGVAPEKCDDLTFARRIYLDLLGRVPSVSELRDFEKLEGDRRRQLVEALVFGEGERAERYARLSAENMARHWRQVLLPSGAVIGGSAIGVEAWLAEQFRGETPYDEIMRRLVKVQDDAAAPTSRALAVVGMQSQYYQLLGGLPEAYAGNISRVMLGVRIECAQCHDHPFTSWKQEDFWGLAAFYSDLGRSVVDDTASKATESAGKIAFEGTQYSAKFLWSADSVSQTNLALRTRLSEWMTSKDNPNFATSAVNRFWQFLIARGLYADVENLDLASQSERSFADELGKRFAEDGFDIRRLVAAICKSDWYQAASRETPVDPNEFYRPLKSVSPEQVFDSMEESLHLSVSRIDPASPRWSGERTQVVSRLGESIGRSPEDYAAGIPQALLMMNGKLTNDAVNQETSRLLRAVTESPFFETRDRIEALYLAVLTRRPSADESKAIQAYLESKADEPSRDRALGELLWALLNSPEFVLCR